VGSVVKTRRLLLYPVLELCILGAALAGPPFVTDDPAPTDFRHYEIYAFAQGSGTRDGAGGSSGIDFNYGAAPDLQLTAVVPVEVDAPKTGPTVAGLGNIELAAKYRILHQEDFGLDVAVFPRLFLPSGSANVGARHFSFLLPIWAGRSWGDWSTFGGGGCVINRSGGSQDYCLMGWALTRKVLPNLLVGAEIIHQGADTKGGRASTAAGAGIIYDISDNLHLLAYGGPGLQNAAETGRYSWYTSVLFTF
jgi:hypothetical protein